MRFLWIDLQSRLLIHGRIPSEHTGTEWTKAIEKTLDRLYDNAWLSLEAAPLCSSLSLQGMSVLNQAAASGVST